MKTIYMILLLLVVSFSAQAQTVRQRRLQARENSLERQAARIDNRNPLGVGRRDNRVDRRLRRVERRERRVGIRQ